MRWLTVLLLTLLMLFSSVLPAQADTPPPELIMPLSFSNGELKGRDFSGQDLRASDFANANLEQADFSHARVQGGIFSASVMLEANLQGAQLQGAMLDQVDLTRADLRDAVLSDTILLRTTFEDVQLAGADFSDAILDGVQVKTLCKTASGTNSQTGISTRDSLGC